MVVWKPYRHLQYNVSAWTANILLLIHSQPSPSRSLKYQTKRPFLDNTLNCSKYKNLGALPIRTVKVSKVCTKHYTVNFNDFLTLLMATEKLLRHWEHRSLGHYPGLSLGHYRVIISSTALSRPENILWLNERIVPSDSIAQLVEWQAVVFEGASSNLAVFLLTLV